MSLDQQHHLGFFQAEMLSKGYLPLKPRRAPEEVDSGDILVVVAGGVYRHIAMVDEVHHLGGVSWKIVDWGAPGGSDVHIHKRETPNLVPDPHKKYGVCDQWPGETHYVFAPPCPPGPAEWGRCGRLTA
jgi:hypothetical protein